MRAATVIVGAVAAASILISLAFILRPGGDSGGGTTTVVRKVVVPTGEDVPPSEEGASSEAGSRSFGGSTQCADEVRVEYTSCAIGEAVHRKYEGGHLGLFTVKDPETGEYLQLNCGEPNPVICQQADGSARVIFPV